MDLRSQQQQQRRQGRLVTSSSAPSQQQRNDESWVEIASQPSSSSLSSIGDEIITTGLRVAGSYPPRRRRSYPARNTYQPANPPPQAGGASSQEEYEASGSEDDRALASSMEQSAPTQVPSLSRFGAQPEPDTDSSEEYDDDDDENATTLGARGTGDYVFRPQPNAFSNPPSAVSRRRHSTSSRPPQRSQTRAAPRQPDFLSPAYQADNDAALRASLTTLLSCAAAARGLSKQKEEEGHRESRGSPTAGAVAGTSNQPMELRLVPESDLMGEASPRSRPAAASPPAAAPSVSPSPARSPSRTGKSKRAATALRGTRASKKKRTEESAALMSPTLMTWVVSAGVVVLVSVVGFGAGYVIGREVGRQEILAGSTTAAAGASVNASDAGCGREVMRSSVRRLRFGGIGRTAVTS
ncbi:uncharacterized protein DNG_03611 [Cephalotrichum gorgonifer]|uniref:Uncharacterized protein n=1 Tax=Cephalotrichum gorgonifer TaxID=2041049 RepID=A0AAE8MX48_9PEZI|nr:uncharacterized protein DNG_03611 [Cephalotrichum gorgonifer]